MQIAARRPGSKRSNTELAGGDGSAAFISEIPGRSGPQLLRVKKEELGLTGKFRSQLLGGHETHFSAFPLSFPATR